MILAPGGPDIPETLLRSQRAGEVMFIVGAGVSRAAGLPLFGELVKAVYERLGQRLPGRQGSLATAAERDALKAGQFDRLIGLLEQRVVYRGTDWHQPSNKVRDAVAELVQPKARSSFSAHLDLLDLSRGAAGVPRIVTTNFDTMFEKAWFRSLKQRLPSHAGSGLPPVGSNDFTGVMHIHGRVGDKRLGLAATELVLSAPNFGEAYMRSGWASRVIYDLLRRYTVILVGYSADDPPMRYMLEATEDGRLNFPDLKQAYALVADEGADHADLREAWKAKGLQPLIFSSKQSGYEPLYGTLRAWADMVKDPLGWSERRLGEIASVQFALAGPEARQEFAFLANEVSSVAVATRQAGDPHWLNAVSDSVAKLDDWTFLVWFRERLNCAETARYAVEAPGPVQLRIASTVDLLLRQRDTLVEEPFARFWQLFCQAHRHREPEKFGRLRLSGPLGAGHIRDFAGQVKPRLTTEKRISFFDAEESATPANIHDLARFHFEAHNADWQKLVERWPGDAKLEERLLGALDRALLEAVDLAAEAGLLLPDGDLMSFDVALVHAPEPDEPLVEPNDRHASNWRLNSPDSNNKRFGPIIRSMTALWLRLASRAPESAAMIARTWVNRDQLIFKRMAAWAATASPAGPTQQMSDYLGATTRRRFWGSDNCPEIARFTCKQWNKLPLSTRRRIESAILDGMEAATIRRRAKPEHRQYLRALYTARELARIRTAGGRLSQPTSTRLRALYRQYDDLPREMPIYAHLYSPSWSGSGYSADLSVVADVADDQLLASVEQYEETQRWEQADLWRALVHNEPARALRVLLQKQAEGSFAPERWQYLLWLFNRPPAESVPQMPTVSVVLSALLQAKNEELFQLRWAVASIISFLAKRPDDPDFALTLQLWDRLLETVQADPEDEEQSKSLLELASSHPLGELTAALITMQSNVIRRAGGGFHIDFADRFDLLTQLMGRSGEIAIAALVRQLRFLDWLHPSWVKSRLLPLLKADTTLAMDLMAVVASSSAMHVPQLFNMLKRPLLRALESESFDQGAREQLSGALLTAAFALIEGKRQFRLTSFEVRHALTRMPNSALASAAWEIGTLLRHEPEEKRKEFWQSTIEPFLRDFWPNDVATRTPEVSQSLAKLPALAGDSFPQAVEVVLSLVRPFALSEVRYGLGLDEGADQIVKYPRSALMLIASVLKADEGTPMDLQRVVQALMEADEAIVAVPAFWRLRQLLRPA